MALINKTLNYINIKFDIDIVQCLLLMWTEPLAFAAIDSKMARKVGLGNKKAGSHIVTRTAVQGLRTCPTHWIEQQTPRCICKYPKPISSCCLK